MKSASKCLSFTLLLVGLILVTVITTFIPGQADLTGKNIYTLSPGSHNIIENLEDPVTIELYYSRSSEGTPIHIKNYATRVTALLRQYARASNGKIDLKVIDPKPDTEEEEAAIRANIAQKQLPTGEPFFFGLTVIQADIEKEIPEFILRKEPFLEYDISRAIHSVQQFGLPRLGVISSLPVFGGYQQNQMNPMNPNPQMTQDWFFIEELRESFDVEQVQADSIELPDELDVLAIIHPQDVSDSLQYAIDQFVLSGKPAFIAVDPSSYSQRSQTSQQAMMMGRGMPNTSSDLTRLFDKWGIEYDAFSFVADLQNGEMVGVSRGSAPVRYPAWHKADNLADDSPPTANLNFMHLIEPGSVSIKEGSGLELTSLIKSSDQSGTLSTGVLNFTPPDQIIRQTNPTGEQFIIAGIVRGKFATAFPEGRPPVDTQDVDDADSDDQSAADDAPGITESAGSSTVIVIADTDFLVEQFSVQRILPGVAIRQNDNLSFISNALEFLAGSEDLISLRGKGTAVRPFKVLQELEVQAQKNYQAEYDALNEELNDVRDKLRELQEREGSRGELVASAEVRRLIENYRNEEADKQAALREIRKKLREDIESLETVLALLNLLVVPIGVGATGIGFFTMRSKRQKRAQR